MVKKEKKIKENNKRYNFFSYFILLLQLILLVKLFDVQIIENSKYKDLYEEKSINITSGSTAPRGRIYDRNYNIIVDNVPVKIIYYEKPTSVTVKEEIEIAYKLADILDIDYSKITDEIKKTFWIKKNSDRALEKITEEEINKLKYREINSSDIESLKKERITEEELNELEDIDLEAAYIYYLMNKGYSYSEKIIKSEDVTDIEYASVASNLVKLKGVKVKLDWDRSYPYGTVFRSILGNVSTREIGIPEDLKEYYLKKGYELDDRVGISYLEYQYDDYLKGTKNKYQRQKDGTNLLVEEGSKGNDIVLTIDINLQQQVEQILEEELLKAKSEANTTYYNKSFVIITNPNTGEILAMAGKQISFINGEAVFSDYTPSIFTSSVVAGSVVKGASHIVGYNTGALTIGEKRYDTCVKLKNSPIKCSWKSLGLLDDITALKQSSNTYQFYTAFKVAGVSYSYDMPFLLENDAFSIYRNTFNEFGLGVKTEIDLPNETTGIKGKNDSGGLLLDFAIGQYDTYTPLQLSQYISTIANGGKRMKYYLLKEVRDTFNFDNVIYSTEPTILNEITTDITYLNRVKEGFKAVLEYGGTGSGYIDKKYKPAGKTGTSQSFVDTDNDGIVDTETVSNTFVAYAPYDNPTVTFTVISPDVYDYGSSIQSYVNKRISKRISEKYFEIYPQV
jgi:cell division protein FtsI/penicillin-binding protein 2